MKKDGIHVCVVVDGHYVQMIWIMTFQSMRGYILYVYDNFHTVVDVDTERTFSIDKNIRAQSVRSACYQSARNGTCNTSWLEQGRTTSKEKYIETHDRRRRRKRLRVDLIVAQLTEARALGCSWTALPAFSSLELKICRNDHYYSLSGQCTIVLPSWKNTSSFFLPLMKLIKIN